MACASCGLPVVLADRHVTVTRHVKQHRHGAVVVLDVETIAWLHLRCGGRIGAVQVPAEPAVALDEPIPYLLTAAAVLGVAS
jgi:hypothetical protein